MLSNKKGQRYATQAHFEDTLNNTPLCNMLRDPNFRTLRVVYLPSLVNHPSLSGLKNVLVISLPSSSGTLKGSFLILSYKLYNGKIQTTVYLDSVDGEMNLNISTHY